MLVSVTGTVRPGQKNNSRAACYRALAPGAVGPATPFSPEAGLKIGWQAVSPDERCRRFNNNRGERATERLPAKVGGTAAGGVRNDDGRAEALPSH